MAKQEQMAVPADEVMANLKKPHRHRGIELPAGAEVTLTKTQAERLARRDVI